MANDNSFVKKILNTESIKQFLFILLILIFAILLGIYIIKGAFVRYSADDYCYGAQIVRHGFWGTQVNSYLNKMPYNSNRYSLTFMYGLGELVGGPIFAPWTTGILIICWGICFYFVLNEVKKILSIEMDKKILIASSLGLVFFSIILAPNQYQTLYWISGKFTYLVSIILVFFMLGQILNFIRHGKSKIGHLLIIGFIAFFAGGFSETTALWQACLFGLLLIIFLKKKKSDADFVKIMVSVFIGTILAVILLAVSPPNALDMDAGNFNSPDLLTLIVKSFSNSRIFISLSLKNNIIPFIVIGLLGFYLALELKQNEERKPKALLLQIYSTMTAGFLLIYATMVPSMMAKSSYPGSRALIPSMVTLVVTVFLVGWMLANYVSISKIFTRSIKILKITAPMIGILILTFVISTTPEVVKNFSEMRGRAEAWDQIHEILLDAQENNVEDVIIPALDSYSEVEEFGENEGAWVNNCGEAYYQVKSITAVENYLGIPAHPLIP